MLKSSSRISRKAAKFDVSDESVASFVAATCFAIPMALVLSLGKDASMEPVRLVLPSSVLSPKELEFKVLILQEAATFFLIESITS